MSIRTYDSEVPGPDLIDKLQTVEASPIYTGIRIKQTITGSRHWDDGSTDFIDQTYDYELERTYDREPMAIVGSAFPSYFENTNNHESPHMMEVFPYELSPADGECNILLSSGGIFSPTSHTGTRNVSFLHQILEIHKVDADTDSVEIGTISIPGDTSPIMASPFSLAVPEFISDVEDYSGTRLLVTHWRGRLEAYLGTGGNSKAGQAADILVSALDWRDLRGVHSFTVEDPFPDPFWLTSTIVATYEWELI